MYRLLALVVVAALPFALGGPGRAPAQGEEPMHVVHLPGLARDTVPPGGGWFFRAGCTVAQGHLYTVVGYDVQPAPTEFFYAHATAASYGEPFTHTGNLMATMFPPGGDPQVTIFDISDPSNPVELLDFGPVGPGLHVFDFSGQPVIPESTFQVDIPQDCQPWQLQTPPGWTSPHTLQGPGAFSNGNCPGFVDTIQVTLHGDGRLRFFQPSTGDQNIGHFWPGQDGFYDFVVVNPVHPEAYVGAISPDLRTFQGKAFWNNACEWDFSLVDVILAY
ncbi:MAG: hypothetical protein Kow0010_10140 [Dehalococcoidia bacterium]